jgi:hypothetical protein
MHKFNSDSVEIAFDDVGQGEPVGERVPLRVPVADGVPLGVEAGDMVIVGEGVPAKWIRQGRGLTKTKSHRGVCRLESGESPWGVPRVVAGVLAALARAATKTGLKTHWCEAVSGRRPAYSP